MKSVLLSTSIFFLLSVAATAADEGKPAPEFTARLFTGEEFNLKDVSGQVTVLHFGATWCEACETEMPALNSYYQKHRTQGLQVVAIFMDDAKDETKAREQMKDFVVKATFARDASYKGYGRIWRLPLTFVIDRKGILRKDGWVTKQNLSIESLDKTVTPLLKVHRD